MEKRLYKSGKNKVLCGVCGGIAEYFNIDPLIVRLVFVALFFGWGCGGMLYLLLWLLAPRRF